LKELYNIVAEFASK